ncbi:MAG: hypothetical protein AABZ60_19510 [Planctomycetota bacterium]
MALFFRKKSPVELAEQLLKELDEKILREEKRFQEERALQSQNPGEEQQPLSTSPQNLNLEPKPIEDSDSEKEESNKIQGENSSEDPKAE